MDDFRYTRIWFAWIRASLSHPWPGAAQAAQSLFALNRHARSDRGGRASIYALKSKLIKLFYDQGRCAGVTLHKQTLECTSRWHWMGSFADDDDDSDDSGCPKCGGTGIYRETLLFNFHFVFEDRAYSWHQPAQLATWFPIGQSQIGGTYHDTVGGGAAIESVDDQARHTAIVCNYLLRHGVWPGFRHPSLVDSLRQDYWNSAAYYRVEDLKRRARHARLVLGGKTEEYDNPF